MDDADRQARIKEVERGHLARQILDNPIWIECWSKYRENLLANILNPNTRDDDVLVVKRMLVAVDRVQRDLEEVMTTSKFAEKQLKDDSP